MDMFEVQLLFMFDISPEAGLLELGMSAELILGIRYWIRTGYGLRVPSPKSEVTQPRKLTHTSTCRTVTGTVHPSKDNLPKDNKNK